MIEAVIWDYDGTLVDSRQKNLNVTRAIISAVLKRSFDEFPVLVSIHDYQQANMKYMHWRDLYATEFGMDPVQTDYAGSLWASYQLGDSTRNEFYRGIHETIRELAQFYPQAIVSLNASENIRVSLEQDSLSPYFKEVFGYEGFDYSKQKPHPEALLTCIDRLGFSGTEGIIVYIGDHEMDAHCVHNANTVFGRKKVISVGALYEKDHSSDTWQHKPDYVATMTAEITGIVKNCYRSSL